MKHKGFSTLIIILIVAAVIIGGLWYYQVQRPISSTPCPPPASEYFSSSSMMDFGVSPAIASATFYNLMPAAHSWLINRLGQNMYNCHVTFDATGTQVDFESGNNRLDYVYHDPIDPLAHFDIGLSFNKYTNNQLESLQSGPGDLNEIPDCSNDPGKCDLRINEAHAASIAGLPQSSNQYGSFWFDPSYNSFVWSFTEICKTNLIEISAANGAVLHPFVSAANCPRSTSNVPSP